MTHPQQIRYAVLPLLLYALLTSCSASGRPGSAEVSSSDGSSTSSGTGQFLPITATAEMSGETFELEVTETPQEPDRSEFSASCSARD